MKKRFGFQNMHIGIISTIKFQPWGGSEELWVQTAKLALEKGIQVSVCFIRPEVDHPKWRDLEQAGARMFYPAPEHSLPNRLASRAGVLSYRLGEHMRERARLAPLRAFFATKPDVLFVNEGGGMLEQNFLSMLRKTMPRTPYLAMFHNNFEQVPSDSWRAALIQFLASAQSVLFVAQATLAATERNLATQLANVRIVRNPVNITDLHIERWPDEVIPRFACVAALDVSRKGQDLALQALSTHSWRQRDWHLSVFGSGEHRRYLQDLVGLYGLASRVEFHGEVHDVRSIWRRHHALLMPSRIESAPLAIVEAMLCGRPIISTDVGGIREWIQDGRNGFLCPAATAEFFSAALERAWERRHEWRQMGVNAHHHAIRMYDPAPAETLLSIIAAAGNQAPEPLPAEPLAKAAAL